MGTGRSTELCGVLAQPDSLRVPFGRYELFGQIGQGGMAEVYAAQQTWLSEIDRTVVIKLIRPEMHGHPQIAAMFLDEARILAEINHSNVVRVYDADQVLLQDGETARSILYIAMEYLPGVTLASLKAQLWGRSDPPPPDLVAALVAQACEGLHAVHELRDAQGISQEVVHRDISPQNLMLLPEGVIKVIDFGIARARGRRSAQTTPGQIKGNLGYMSPEQLHTAPIDRRSDVFSAAVVLYELCSGLSPFARETIAATMMAVGQCAVPPLRAVRSDVPLLLHRAVHQALSQDPEKRPPTAAAFADLLQEVVRRGKRRFASGPAIAHYLTERGAVLRGPEPAPLRKVPWFLDQPTAPAARAINPAPVTAPPRAGPDELTHRVPIPDPFEGQMIADRYRLLRQFAPQGPIRQRSRYRKRWYLASAVNGAGPSGNADGDDPLCAVALCGCGEALDALPADPCLRLSNFARRRARLGQAEHLAVLQDFGVEGDDSPFYLVTPYHARNLANSSPMALPRSAKLHIARQLWVALARARALDPSFVHGDLKPENVALDLRPGDAHAVVLLDFDLASVLSDPTEDATPATVPLPYTSPQRRAGAPPSASDDVFAVGMILYKLFGEGDRPVDQNSRPDHSLPRLPPQQEVPEHVEAAIFAALRTDPDQRPSAATLASLMADEPPRGHSSGGLTVLAVPASDRLLEHRLEGDRLLRSQSLTLNSCRSGTRVRLPLSAALVPPTATLWLLINDDSLEVQVDPPARLYLNINAHSSRRGSYIIPSTVSCTNFDVGNRRAGAHRIHYAGTRRSRRDQSLHVDLDELGLRLVSTEALQQLAAFYTIDPQTDSVHLVCVGIP